MDYPEMDDAYESYGITVKAWFAECTNSYFAPVFAWDERRQELWNYERRIIARDGLVSLQVTVHHDTCWTCRYRVLLVKQLIADQNVQCFWTREPDDVSLYVTVGPLPPGMPPSRYLTSLFCVAGSGRGLIVLEGSYKSPKQSHRTKQRPKPRRPKRPQTVQ
jgi:hypothetical protein